MTDTLNSQAASKKAWRKKNIRMLAVHTSVKAKIDTLKDRLGERSHSFPTINEVLAWALTAANEKLDGGKEKHLEGALREVRGAILNAHPEVLTDTLWVSDIETAVDHIDAALGERT